MKTNTVNFKKICAIVTASCFMLSVLSNVSYASIPISAIQSQKNIFDIKNTEQLNNLFSDKYGKIISVNNNLSDTIVINIQDLHCDYSIQKNISLLIEEISNKYNIEEVYVEGGIGNIDTHFLSSINSKYKKTVLEKLLKEGKLTGTEYYSIIKNKTNLLKGLEEKDSYLQNIVRLSNIIKSKKETSSYISKISKEIDFLKEKYLNLENKQFSELIQEKNKGNITQEEFLQKLFNYAKENNINTHNYKNLQTYLKIYNKNFINKNSLKKELIEITKEIKENVSYSQYQQFINNTSNLTNIRNLEICINNYCLSQCINLDKKYPNLSKFFVLKKESFNCNPIELVKEERKLIDIIRTMLSESEAEIEVAYICDFEDFYKNYLTASLTAKQWEYVKLGLDKFKELYAKYSIENDVEKLDKYSEELNLFYDTNTHRNEIFVKNMKLESNKNIEKEEDVSILLSKAKKIKILVAGGYHTDGINEILNQNNITNITITPSITNSTQKTRLNYEYLVQKQAMSIRQMIALGLISNATQKEQITIIINSLMSNQNLDGTNINILVEQLNQIFEQNIKVSLTQDRQQIEFLFTDGKKEFVDIDENIAKIIEEQNKIDLDSTPLVRIEGEKLKEITELAIGLSLNGGQEIFAPQIYQISKDICIFMVKNKWYLGNGAIWEIATNPEYAGQTLDGVEPIIYEYMPDAMQKTLLDTQQKKDSGKKSFIKNIVSIIKRIIASLLLVTLLFTTTSCSLINKNNQPQSYQIQEIQITEEKQNFNDEIEKYADSFFVGNGEYKSFLYEKMPEFYQNNTTYKYVVKNIENLYDQALVALSYMQIGEMEKASKVLGAIYNKPKLNKSNLEDTLNTGEIVWVGIAAVQYKILTGSNEYDGLIEKVDKYLKIVQKQDGSYFGEVVYSWVSTEHMLDIVAYYNLRTLYDDSEETKEKLKLAADYLYTSLYNEYLGTFRRGLEDEHYVLDTNSWGIQVLLALQEINPEIYKNSQASKIDIQKLLSYAEENYKTTISEGEKKYENLYKWSSEKSSPVSFEWTMEMAVSYNMLADYYEKNKEPMLAQECRDKADAIFKDVQDYSQALGIESGYIAYSDKNEVRNYFSSTEGGWLVYVVPAICTTVGQRVQLEYGSFFKPLTRIKDYDYSVEEKDYESVGFIKQEGDNWKTYSTVNTLDLREAKTITIKMSLVKNVQNANVKVQFLPMPPNPIQNLEGTGFGSYNKQYYFDQDGKLTIKINMEDFKKETFGITSNATLKQLLMDLEYIKVIISAGETCFGNELNSTKLDIDIESIEVDYNDSSNTVYKQLCSNKLQQVETDTLEVVIDQKENMAEPKTEYVDTSGVKTEFVETSGYVEPLLKVPSTIEVKNVYNSEKEETSSVLLTTMKKINDLIVDGVSTNNEFLKLILKEETIYSYFSPDRFVKEHLANNKGAKLLTTITDISKIFAVGLSVAFCMIPVVDITIKMLVAPMILILFPIITNMIVHTIIDFRYLKSIGVEEAIALYGKENVSLTQQGLNVKNKNKKVSVYVINDKPKNAKEFEMKSVPIKIKAENGKLVKCWIGNYKGAPIIFAEGAKYEMIVKEFSKTRQFKTVFGKNTALKTNIDVIEVDMNNPEARISYSENGNILVGANVVKKGNNIDVEKEVSLLNNKKIEAITINQNIAVYIDDEIETLSSSQDFMNIIDLYVKNNSLGTNAKILFSTKYIDRVLELLETELGNKDITENKFIEIIQKLKEENKEVIVMFDEENKDYNKYKKYGIFSYIANNEYVDGITSAKAQTKFVTNLNKITSFDGSLSIIKVSVFKKEIEKASGIFTFLTSSINLKEYMKNRNINFIKQVATNFDYNQIPNIDMDIILKMLKAENKFEELSKYLVETDSISMYYLGLKTKEEKSVFVDAILERILVVNYLREYDKDLDSCYGLRDKKLEDLLSLALIAKYNKDGNLKISSQITINEKVKATDFEIEFSNILSQKVSLAFKDINVSKEINDPQSIDDIIRLIPLYAERNIELRTSDVKVVDLESIKGILSAA